MGPKINQNQDPIFDLINQQKISSDMAFAIPLQIPRQGVIFIFSGQRLFSGQKIDNLKQGIQIPVFFLGFVDSFLKCIAVKKAQGHDNFTPTQERVSNPQRCHKRLGFFYFGSR